MSWYFKMFFVFCFFKGPSKLKQFQKKSLILFLSVILAEINGSLVKKKSMQMMGEINFMDAHKLFLLPELGLVPQPLYLHIPGSVSTA